MNKTIKIGISPCPNDTFIFYALINNKIDSRGFKFELIIEDVEDLNKLIISNQLDVSKISFHTYIKIYKNYQILNSGSALGYNNGPLIISKRKIYPDELDSVLIAIPGINTTANLLLNIYNPKIVNRKEYLFSDIEEAVLSSEVDAGLIIHESRFTYEAKGLMKIVDLGEFWNNKFKLPLPLGGIVINRNIEQIEKSIIDDLIKQSVLYGFKNPMSSMPFIKKYSTIKNEEIINKHIKLYVNRSSIELGEIGKKSIECLFENAIDKKLFSELKKDIFIK